MKRSAPMHPKILMLAGELKLPRYAAVGLMECLWHWTAQYAAQGDIGRYSDQVIADAIGWVGDPCELCACLVRVGWFDLHPVHRMTVHDWSEHADDAVHMCLARKALIFVDGTRPKLGRISKEERTQIEAVYAAKPQHSHGTRTAHAQCADVERTALPSPPIPSPPKPMAASQPSAPPADASGPAALRTVEEDAIKPEDCVFPIFPTARGSRNGPTTWTLTKKFAIELGDAFPRLDIRDQAIQAHLWIKTNLAERKTASGMPDFLRRWMSREQNRGGPARASPADRESLRRAEIDRALAEQPAGRSGERT